jgi:hypothetical protein
MLSTGFAKVYEHHARLDHSRRGCVPALRLSGPSRPLIARGAASGNNSSMKLNPTKLVHSRRGRLFAGAAGLCVAAAVARRRKQPPALEPSPEATPAPAPEPTATSPLTAESDVPPTTSAAPAPQNAEPATTEGPDDDTFVAREEAAAGAAAGAIGGRVPHDSADPALDPVYQAGGGEQDGFEEAEAELIDNATHGGGRGDPLRDAFTEEEETDRSTVVYGEPDEIQSSETEDEVQAGPETDEPGRRPA